jgi:hypothetical protein
VIFPHQAAGVNLVSSCIGCHRRHREMEHKFESFLTHEALSMSITSRFAIPRAASSYGDDKFNFSAVHKELPAPSLIRASNFM